MKLLLNLLDLTTLTILAERYKLCSSLWSLVHSQFWSLLVPNICLRILFSCTNSQRPSLNLKCFISQPYSTAGRIIVLYILIFNFLERLLRRQKCLDWKIIPFLPSLMTNMENYSKSWLDYNINFRVYKNQSVRWFFCFKSTVYCLVNSILIWASNLP
jgi:hypothetical protein